MTDAAIAITQSVVEGFTEQYLRSLDCSIAKAGERWEVSVPNDVDSELPTGEVTLLCGDSSIEPDGDEVPLHRESSFFRDVVAEASERTPVGRIALASEDIDVEVPPLLRESPVDVTDVDFTPYYDRSAAVILYRIRIETVSEYQTELLTAIALDVRSMDELPGMERAFLDVSVPGRTRIGSNPIAFERDQVEQLLGHSRQVVVDRVQPTIDEIHQEASRAADAELEEFRQFQQQRLEELQEEKASLSAKIDELSSLIQEDSGEGTHVEDLKRRKDLRAELEDVESEIGEIKRQREEGFPDTQKEIRDRHALEVVVSPLTITQVEYERGEIEFELAEDSISRSISVGYGSGIGVTEEIHCEFCNQTLSGDNPLVSVQNGIRCRSCRS